ncbi:unnamed protein product [Callosobruchus maculatus]|uniref:Uncharacterized protein n=1 Tax=Callosobruchus maculatus TaxID=64391 RepID=A0A653DM08_CALMS|nr:unnamed protein product [Callosobruchus maculatus]
MTMKTRKTNCADSQIAESPRHSGFNPSPFLRRVYAHDRKLRS